MTICLPKGVEMIINKLEENNFEAYAVGGCVRDSILGRNPDDWDITTSAKPEQIKAVFDKTIDTGIKHGTVKVMIDGEGFEVTTYRLDGKYSDGRHPDKVTFTPDLLEDLKRRDFTINAMAYNPNIGFVDKFNGIEDLKNKIIRCVGNPLERFDEDALRILRAVRFAAQLGFSIEEKTICAIKELAGNLNKISVERIQTELVKLLVSNQPYRIRDLYEYGITKIILPEFDEMMVTEQNTKHHMYSVGEHTIKVMENVRPDKVMRITALLHDIAKPDKKITDENGVDHFYGHPEAGQIKAKAILRRLKFDNDTISRVSRLIKWHDYRPNTDEKSLRRALNKVGADIFCDLLEIKRADILAQSDYQREKKLSVIDDYEMLYQQILKNDECFSLKDLAINGRDLIDAGIAQGTKIGETLNKLLEIVIDDPSKNNKEVLLEIIRKK